MPGTPWYGVWLEEVLAASAGMTLHSRLHRPHCLNVPHENAGTHWPTWAMAGLAIGV